MDSQTLRKKFLEYFEAKGHTVLPSASLVPENDPTALFTSAGMQSLTQYLLGEKHHAGDKLVNFQKCIRTGDIDEVGDETHLTFFEMMGYWSLGDYWKKEAIGYTFDFFTKELSIDIKNIAVTCFEGEPENNISRDDESAEIWISLGVPEERIAFLGREDNFWGPVGESGPCGPDSEIFVWTGEGAAPEKYDPSDKKWVEMGNDVFMQFEKTADNKYELLSQKNVDFGAGFERIVSYIEGKSNVYETELFEPILAEIERVSGKKYFQDCHSEPIRQAQDKLREESPKKGAERSFANSQDDDENTRNDIIRSFRIIADHLKAATFMINDGVAPSNKDRGYVLRRLIRRAVVKGQQLEISENFTTKIAEKVFEIYEGIYFGDSNNCHPERQRRISGDSSAEPQNDNKQLVLSELDKEETKFRKTLKDGLKILESKAHVSGKDLFDLYQSFGIPSEISIEEIARLKSHLEPNAVSDYEELFKKHQELSRTASAGMFKGGLADAGVETTKLHTAAHLLLQALRQVLGEDVYQKGSNITAERLRFDFSHSEKLTPEQIKEAEDIVNEKIEADLPVTMEEITLEEAKKSGAMGVFESKYGERVKIYTIGVNGSGGELFSREICGGPHVTHTGDLGHFKIQKEESSSAGVRRIKAILE